MIYQQTKTGKELTDIQTDRQRHNKTAKQAQNTDIQKDRQTESQTDIQTNRQIDSHGDRHLQGIDRWSECNKSPWGKSAHERNRKLNK